MAVYFIGYDLNRPGQDYTNLENAIKEFATWWHHLDSTWLVSTNWLAEQIRDDLRQHIDANDKLLVAKLSGEAAWFGFTPEGSKWLKEQLEANAVN